MLPLVRIYLRAININNNVLQIPDLPNITLVFCNVKLRFINKVFLSNLKWQFVILILVIDGKTVISLSLFIFY